MMAHASKDPLWQATVEFEVQEAPGLQAVIEDKCTTCHAPLGRTQAIHDGQGGYSLAEVRTSSLALDGVSCTLCHQIQPANLGETDSFSGGYVITTARDIFGPYQDMFVGPMVNQTGYTPRYGAHVNDSELCATCHTLFTPSVDATGNVIGTFPEQTPYLEWQNSVYAAEGTECQGCHMPRVDEAIKISTRPAWLEGHSPFFRHDFVGGNAFLLTLIRDHATELGITATTEQLNEKIALTRERLTGSAAHLSASARTDEGALVLDIEVENRTGHKFPTGFPSRRAWLHVRVAAADGSLLFSSGAWDVEGRIEGLVGGVEPHHDLITTGSQVQIYEPVLEDSEGNPTFTLLRAFRYRKDNRLPPRGFVSEVPGYEDIAVTGAAADDGNFNRSEDGEGTGRDSIRYEVDVSGYVGPATVTAQLLFQTVRPEFVDHLRTRDTPAGDRFIRQYDTAEKMPEILQSVDLEVFLTGTGNGAPFRRGDPSADGSLDLSDAVLLLLYLFQGHAAPECLGSADVDADAVIVVTDAIYLLQFLFLGGAAPPAPFATCGFDDRPDALTCESYPPCAPAGPAGLFQ
jgi:hypothetical protein